MQERILILENGKTFTGYGFGSGNTTIGEVVVNTSMVGYQEIISDPSNASQIVVMSYPLIGNYGMTDEDYESKNITTSGLVVKEYNDTPSNFRFTKTLGEVMEDGNSVGIYGIDTRELTKEIRENGTMLGMIANSDVNVLEAIATLKSASLPNNLAKQISTKNIWYSRTRNPLYTVVCIDFGVKLSFIRQLNASACNVVVVPCDTSYEDIMKHNPDGIFLSNGAGSPLDLTDKIHLVNKFKGKLPILGVAIGCGLIGLAYNAEIEKLKFGHRGCNHPIKNLATGKIHNLVQNHSYAIKEQSLKNTTLKVSHIDLTDNVVEGVIDEENMIVGVQYYPEYVQNQNGCDKVFEDFKNFMNKNGGEGNVKENRY